MMKYLQKNFCACLTKALLLAGINFILASTALAQTLVTSSEAESGTRSGGLTIATARTGYSGSGYVTNMVNAADILTIPVTVPSAGNYKLVIRYNGPYGDKDQNVYVNGSFLSSLHFPATTGYTDLTAGSLTLKAGANTIAIYSGWGYTDFDKITLYTVALHDYTTVDASPIDPAATPETIALYNYLKSTYGQSIISGQTSDYYNTVSPNAAKKPLIRAYDFQHYTVGYPYLWNNSTASHAFGWEDDGTTQAAIDWYNSTCQKGMVAFHWHWHSPSGGQVGTNTFYTNSTTFDVTKAVTQGTAEYAAIIRDIDSIATQLKRLQAAGVPVLWRPLHEAGGAWFWWGAKGPAAALALYDIVYNRIVNYHNIHNLIWQWSTPEPNWYPGNAKVDMLGYDSYPGAYNYGTQKLIFDQLYTIVNGQKMLAMTENGPIPDPDALFTGDAKWSYFMSWSDLVTQQNSAAHLMHVYNHAKVLTLDEVSTATNTAKLTAAGPTSICSGGSVLLKANAAKGYTYKWYNTANLIPGATSATYSAIATGSYTVAVTATGTCTTTSTPVVVTVGGPPATIIPVGATTFCQGGSVLLNAIAGTGLTYQWYKDANLISGATTSAYTANATGLYSVKVTASTCSTTSAGTQVTVNAPPVIPIITVSGVSTFCTGFKTQLNVTSEQGSSLVWLLNGSTSPNQSGVITTGGSYSVTATKLGCSSTSASTVITVNDPPIPTITVSGPTTFCQGGSVDLTAGSGTSYEWYEGTTLLTGATNAKYTAYASGNYKVKVFNPSGCDAFSASTLVTVTATAAATITPGGPTSFCPGGSVVLTASSGTSYKWMLNGNAISGATTSTYIANSTGSYAVEVTNGTNCKAVSVPTTVTITPQPIATITVSSPTTFCQGGSVVLTASTGSSYKWMLNGNAISGATNSTFTAYTTGSYSVEVSNGINCKATSTSIQVTVTAPAVASISAGGSTTFCQGASVVLTASSGTSYKWMLNGNAISGATNSAYTANSTGLYSVEVTNVPNCKATSTAISVTVNALPTATISVSQSTAFCQAYLLTASSGAGYQWMLGGNAISGATNSTYTGTGGNSYTVEITNASSCKATYTVTLPMISIIAVTITPGGPITFCPGGSVVLTATTGSSYKWMLNGNSITGATNVTYTANLPGSYTVEVTSEANCKATSGPTTITIASPPAPTISASGPTTFCQGGSVVLTSSAGPSYKWLLNGSAISGATNSTYTAKAVGLYTVEITSSPNCTAVSNSLDVAASSSITWYLDTDGDGLGDASSSTQACAQPNRYVATPGDECPVNANKTAPGNCGCDKSETECLDCMGVPNGEAALDICNVCAGGNSGITPKTNVSQCTVTSTTSALSTNLKMYPNPTVNDFTIELTGSAFRVTMYTSTGVLVFSKEFEKEAVIGSELSQGIYLVRIEQEGNVELRKLVKE